MSCRYCWLRYIMRVSPAVNGLLCGWSLTGSLSLRSNDPRQLENYFPITEQVTVNEVFEQLLSKRWSTKFESRFSDNLTAYGKRNTCETALLSLTENWKKALDEHIFVRVLSNDMSEAFDSLHQPLMLAKLKAYSVLVTIVSSYLTLI